MSCQAFSRIRGARSEDAADCARLVLESAAQFLPAVFVPRIGAAIERLAAGRGNLFSHEHTWIAEAEGGRVAGMVLGYTARQRAAENPRTGLALLRLLGLDLLSRLGRLHAAQAAIERLETNEYYLSNVAVDQECRGRGIGAALVAAAEQQAARAGCSAIVLDVETDNAGAIRLYVKLGFTEKWKTAPLMLDGTAFSFFRMTKPLQ